MNCMCSCRVLPVTMSAKGGKYFVGLGFFSFLIFWLHFWLFLRYSGEKLDVPCSAMVGSPLCQRCVNTNCTMLFCPMEWNMLHLCVGALAPHDGKNGHMSRPEVEGVAFNRASWKVGHLGDIFLRAFLIGELQCWDETFLQLHDSRESRSGEQAVWCTLICRWAARDEQMQGRRQLWVLFQWMRLHSPEVEIKKSFLPPAA